MKKNTSSKNKKPFFKRRGIKILLAIVILLIGIRIALPYAILKYVNKSLREMKGYYGNVNDIDLALYRGAYKINNIYLNKVDTLSMEQTEFFQSRVIDLSIEWQALLDGKIVGELDFEDPRLKFTKDKVEPKEISNDTSDFRDLLDKLMPLRVNRFEIINGVIQYTDNTSNPKVDIQMDNTHVLAENLTTEKSDDILPSTVTADANIYKGHLHLNMRLNALADKPTFDMNTELKETHLPELNEFFKAYGKFDVNRGVFGLYAEVAAKQGKFVGYVKPVIKDLDVLGAEDRKDNILQKMWEAVVGGAGQLLRNQKHDQVATKVPLEGTFEKTDANIWYAIIQVLKNAFIQALQPSIDQEINISSVGKEEEKGLKIPGVENKDAGNKEENKEDKEKKGLFKKIFKKDKEKEDEKSDSSQEKK
jgi:hypothetical protein